ncbi:MAG TPA: hypothetical protein VH280_06405 [Verrucomicrobiae bacterium]|jgi:glucuronoarabinoxylan endo-1,4-beta-xylanase|nr:hypothetical protein [Verrucomicrobiae bacterium]
MSHKRFILTAIACIAGFGELAVHRVEAATVTVNTTNTYQTILGLGGATAFYTSWIYDHPYKQEVYANAFAGLNLSMLRLGNWFRYTNGPDYAAFDIVSNARLSLGHPVPILMSSWAPPAFLKSNGHTENGGTLVYTNGSYAYTNFAQYWYDSLAAYRSNGVSPTWISIQNEPDFSAPYDSCRFDPTEDTVNGTNYASYSKALDATYQRLNSLPSPPLLVGPECVGVGYNDVQNYAATMNPNSFYCVAHHLYHGSVSGTPDGYNAAMLALTNVFPAKPRFMTEYYYSNMIQTAWLMHDCFTVENASAFNFWSLIWPAGAGPGLVQIENPYNLSSWTNAPPGSATEAHGYWLSPAYWAMKHFSYFLDPGFVRVSVTNTDPNVLTSAFIAPSGQRLVIVCINTNSSVSSTVTLNPGGFAFGRSSVYQTAGTNYFQSLGAITNSQALPPLSLTTLVLDQIVSVGMATNPLPVNDGSGVALNTLLTWMPGSNALTHAVYLGINSNAVARATTASQEFQGFLSSTNFSASLGAGLTYFWRVDEISGINTNPGTVWSFATMVPSASFILNASDGFGFTSFNAIGNWVTNGTASPAASAPGPGGTYNTGRNTLRTPTTGNATFGGASLTLSAGAPAASGSLLLKGPNGATVVVNNLIMSGGVLGQGVNSGLAGVEWLAGNMNLAANSFVSGFGTTSRYIGIEAELSGNASLSNDCNVIYSGDNIAFTGQLIVGSGGVIEAGAQANLGGPGAQLLLNNGTFQPTASFAINNPGGNLALGPGGGILQINPGLTLTISNPIVGSGNLLCNGGGILQIAGANSATGNLIVSNGSVALLGNATFQNAQLSISNGATLDLTALSVPLSINKAITLAGNLAVTINKTNVTTLLDSSNVTFGGTLSLKNPGPALVYGDTVKVFSAANYSGAFNSVIPAPAPGLLWNTNWLSVNGTLFVTSTNLSLVTPPRIANFQISGGNLVLAGTNGNAPGTSFYTLASTNLALPITNWTIIATNQFGSGGGFICTNQLNSTGAQQFFMLRLAWP